MSQAELVKDLGKVAKLTGRDIGADALVFFAEVIAEAIPVDQARAALRKWAMSQSRFPTPGDLIGMVQGPQLQPKQMAAETTTRMLGMISRRGYTWTDTFRYDGHETFEDAVRAELGNEAIGVLNMCGGWQRFCQQFDEGVNGNVRAQLRDLLETQIVRTQMQQHRASLDPPRGKTDEIGEFIAKHKALRAAREKPVIKPMPADLRDAVPVINDEDLPFT